MASDAREQAAIKVLDRDGLALGLAYLERRYPDTYCCMLDACCPKYELGLGMDQRPVPLNTRHFFGVVQARRSVWQAVSAFPEPGRVVQFDPVDDPAPRLAETRAVIASRLALSPAFTDPFSFADGSMVGGRGPAGIAWSGMLCLLWIETRILGWEQHDLGRKLEDLPFSPTVRDMLAVDDPVVDPRPSSRSIPLYMIWVCRFARMQSTGLIGRPPAATVDGLEETDDPLGNRSAYDHFQSPGGE